MMCTLTVAWFKDARPAGDALAASQLRPATRA